jgi:hypothetical protein
MKGKRRRENLGRETGRRDRGKKTERKGQRGKT